MTIESIISLWELFPPVIVGQMNLYQVKLPILWRKDYRLVKYWFSQVAKLEEKAKISATGSSS
jgi:hypothetical protein